jgi:hypothetical protein
MLKHLLGISIFMLTGCVGDVFATTPYDADAGPGGDDGATTSDADASGDRSETLHPDGSDVDADSSGDTSVVALDASDAADASSSLAHCTDGIKDDGESDVDCGGTCGMTCKTGKSCTSATDCISGSCSGSKCL